MCFYSLRIFVIVLNNKKVTNEDEVRIQTRLETKQNMKADNICVICMFYGKHLPHRICNRGHDVSLTSLILYYFGGRRGAEAKQIRTIYIL